MELPLLESDLMVLVAQARTQLVPDRAPGEGEQYRFHFDMAKCIGCKCCVVACSEQNGNPAAIQWRRVGEVEGGYFPNTRRHYLSMGCNHCVDPSCLRGCPVEAYTKLPSTGVVVHSADACIGCQYCVWNCSYGVPQYNEERGVVGKCDLCHNRLSDGMAPACANACPEEAIGIEIVNVAEWRASFASLETPGMPSEDDSISTTRITLPAQMPPDLGRVDTMRVELEHPHWPLVVMLVLTQMSIGAFIVLWLADMSGEVAWFTLAVAVLSLGASVLHLGRPVHAYRALRNLRRSWLSREVLGLGMFAGVASGYALALGFDWSHRQWVGALTAVCGIAGAYCSARLYIVPARPMWNSKFTFFEFASTACLLGPLSLAAMTGEPKDFLLRLTMAGAGLQLLTASLRLVWLMRAETPELKASGTLLTGRLLRHFVWRLLLLIAGGIVLPAVSLEAAFVMCVVGEVLGRWLFFVSVVPRNMAAGFSSVPGGEA